MKEALAFFIRNWQIAAAVIIVIGLMAFAGGAFAEGTVINTAVRTSATVTCEPATTREDGSPLPANEIAGMIVYWGSSPDNLNNDSGVTVCPYDIDISGMELGQYYTAVSTNDTSGQEGGLSDPVPFELIWNPAPPAKSPPPVVQ